MNFTQQFKQHLDQNRLFNTGDRLVVAVSGGVDSIVLCYLLRELGFIIKIVHVNFQLRGEESTRDEQFVKSWADQNQIPYLIKRFNTLEYSKEHGVSIQVAARELRYSWFFEVLEREQQFGPSYLVTAHHRDDSIETLLMNLFKGTGIAGLRGIQAKQGKLIRPLLFASKEEIEGFAKERNLSWVEDSSNVESKYTRNYVRLEIIPAIQNRFPKFADQISATIANLTDAHILYEQAVGAHLKKLVSKHKDEYHLPVLLLKQTVPLKTVLFEFVKDFGFLSSQLDDLLNLLDADTGKWVSSPTHRMIKHRSKLILAPLAERANATQVLDEVPGRKTLPIGILEAKISNTYSEIEQEPTVACLDAKKLSFPIVIRPWKQGDYFYPLGMNKKKKLNRFLIDQKLSVTEKEQVWVVSSAERIVWVIGHRIDHRFRITSETKTVLKLSIQ